MLTICGNGYGTLSGVFAAEGEIADMKIEDPALYLRSQQEDEFVLVSVTDDELKQLQEREEALTETVFIVFSLKPNETESTLEQEEKVELPKVMFDKKQMKYIKKVGEVFSEIVIVMQGCILEEETECKESKTEEESTEISLSNSGSQRTLNGAAAEGNADDGADGEEGRVSESSKNSSDKDVTVTLEWDEVEAEDESIYAAISINSVKAVTSGKITVTFDKNIMTINDVDEGEIIDQEDVELKIDGLDSQETIEISFTSKNGVIVDESVAEPYFDLKKAAKNGDTYQVEVKVEEMRTGNKDLTTEVKNPSVTVGANNEEDESDAESETETQQKTTSGTRTVSTVKTPKDKNAPKTGDNTQARLLIIAMFLATGVIVYVCFKKKKTK